MEIRCKILKMRSRVAPECGREPSDHLGEPRRWSWLASQWDHLLLRVRAAFGFSLAALFSFFKQGSNSEGKADINILIHSFIFVCSSIGSGSVLETAGEDPGPCIQNVLCSVCNHALIYFPTFSFL